MMAAMLMCTTSLILMHHTIMACFQVAMATFFIQHTDTTSWALPHLSSSPDVFLKPEKATLALSGHKGKALSCNNGLFITTLQTL